jgi:hypothetical protein
VSTLDNDGWIVEDPRSLAINAGYDIETYSLARAVASESGDEPYKVKRAIAFAVKNEASRRGVTVFAVTTTTKQRGPSYRYGRQYHKLSGDSRYVSTAQDPSREDLEIASKTLSEPGFRDPIMGSSRFFEPGLQDRKFAAGAPGYRKDSAMLLASWASEGWEATTTIGSWIFLRHESVEWGGAIYASAGTKAAGWIAAIGAAALATYAWLRG